MSDLSFSYTYAEGDTAAAVIAGSTKDLNDVLDGIITAKANFDSVSESDTKQVYAGVITKWHADTAEMGAVLSGGHQALIAIAQEYGDSDILSAKIVGSVQ